MNGCDPIVTGFLIGIIPLVVGMLVGSFVYHWGYTTASKRWRDD